MIKLLAKSETSPGTFVEQPLPFGIDQSEALDCSESINLPIDKEYQINGAKVLGQRQLGLGAPLELHTFTATLAPEDVIALNLLYSKVRSLESMLKTHGMVAE